MQEGLLGDTLCTLTLCFRELTLNALCGGEAGGIKANHNQPLRSFCDYLSLSDKGISN